MSGNIDMADRNVELDLRRYLFVSEIVPEARCRQVYDHIVARATRGLMIDGDSQVPGTPAAYADPVAEGLLEELLPTVAGMFGRDLVPTNSYLRLYKRGDRLPRHRDIAHCECSVSVCFGYEPDEPWAFLVEEPDGGEAEGVMMRPGDGVLYYGMECPHWRETYEGDRLAQVFFHYVDKNGPHASRGRASR